MDSLNAFLSASRSLTMGVEAWDRHSRSPGWVRDQFIAIDHFHDPNAAFEIVEAVIAEPVTYGKPSTEFYLSMVLQAEGAQPIEYDIGLGRFTRPNQPGSMVFADFTKPFHAQGKGPYHTLVLYLKRELMVSRICELLGREIDSLEPLHRSAFFDPSIEVMLKQLLSECRRHPCTGEKLTQAGLVDAIIGRLASLAVSSNSLGNALLEKEPPSDQMRPKAMDRVIEYMHAHFDRNLTRDELAGVAEVSPCHFSRLFRQTTGFTAKRFLMLLRLEKASALLRSGHASETILETARRCGFDSESHFHEEFRQRFGVTPAAYQTGE